MRVPSLLAALALAGALPAFAKDEVPLPEPPTTPLPAFENPLHDAKIGETLRYRVSATTRPSGPVVFAATE